MKKYNLSEIFARAWNLVKNHNSAICPTITVTETFDRLSSEERNSLIKRIALRAAKPSMRICCGNGGEKGLGFPRWKFLK